MYVNAWGIVNVESTLDSFIVGFQLGARFAYDTFVNKALGLWSEVFVVEKSLYEQISNSYM